MAAFGIAALKLLQSSGYAALRRVRFCHSAETRKK
jgi:hypothetical protein